MNTTACHRLASLILVALLHGCATPKMDHPAWYCGGTASLANVDAVSAANLNADGSVFQFVRQWHSNFASDGIKLGVGSWFAPEDVSVSILQPTDFRRNVDRVEIRLGSPDQPQNDPSLVRDDPHNGSNVYIFHRSDLVRVANPPAFFVAVNGQGHVWRAVPLDLSVIAKGEKAMTLADANLAEKTKQFSTRCLRATGREIVIT